MDYDRQVSLIADYLRRGEKDKESLKIGMELEHFITEQDGKNVAYEGERGVCAILKKIEAMGYEGIYEGENILGINHEDFSITLEPGGQIEFSAVPSSEISVLKGRYEVFYGILNQVVSDYGLRIQNLGYLPKDKIKDISLIPKKRYQVMYRYFENKGCYAHNMMKGTASLQVAVDYRSEKDFHKKFYVANALVPMIYAMFDNSPMFEGEPYKGFALRSMIWNNTDPDRCGIVEGAMNSSFTYEDFAQYILDKPPILILEDGELKETGDKKAKDVFRPDKADENGIEHLLSMNFSDVRVRNYLEIRVPDSVPEEYALGLCAMCKGIFYHRENLNDLYDFFRNTTEFQIEEAKKDILREGIHTEYAQMELVELFDRIITDARYGLEQEEQVYLKPLDNLARSEMTLRERYE